MTTRSREDLRLEFNAWFTQKYPQRGDDHKEMAWAAFQVGNALGFNDGMSAACQMENE